MEGIFCKAVHQQRAARHADIRSVCLHACSVPPNACPPRVCLCVCVCLCVLTIAYGFFSFSFLDQVGTPGRMRALAAAGSLRLDSSALVVLDVEKNIKGRSVLDMDGVSGDTMAFLAECVRPHLASSAHSGKEQKGGGGNQGKRAAVAAGATGQLRIALY